MLHLVDVDSLIIENELGHSIGLRGHVDCVRADETVLVEVNIEAQVEVGRQQLVAVGVAVRVPLALGWLSSYLT